MPVDLEAPSTPTPAAVPVDPRLADRMLDAAGDLEGRSVLVVGSPALAEAARQAGAARVALVGGEAPPGVACHDGPFAAPTFDAAYDVVLLLSGEQTGDVFPVIARACAVASRQVVAFFPAPARGWFRRAPADESHHDPARLREWLAMAGATDTEDRSVPGGFVVVGRVG